MKMMHGHPMVLKGGDDVAPGVRRIYMFPSLDSWIEFSAKLIQADISFEFIKLRANMEGEFNTMERKVRLARAMS